MTDLNDGIRTVDAEISLVPYYPNEETALPWYQDPDVCRQVDNIDHVYTSCLLYTSDAADEL